MNVKNALFGRVAAISACTLLAGCGGKALECPPAEPPHVTSAPLPDTSAAEARERALEERVEALIVERDSAKQWAAEEQHRQEKEMALRRKRIALEAEVWLKLDDIDPKLTDAHTRVAKWNMANPRLARDVMNRADVLRARIEKDLRRIDSEPDSAFDALQIELTDDLANVASLLDSPALGH